MGAGLVDSLVPVAGLDGRDPAGRPRPTGSAPRRLCEHRHARRRRDVRAGGRLARRRGSTDVGCCAARRRSRPPAAGGVRACCAVDASVWLLSACVAGMNVMAWTGYAAMRAEVAAASRGATGLTWYGTVVASVEAVGVAQRGAAAAARGDWLLARGGRRATCWRCCPRSWWPAGRPCRGGRPARPRTAAARGPGLPDDRVPASLLMTSASAPRCSPWRWPRRCTAARRSASPQPPSRWGRWPRRSSSPAAGAVVAPADGLAAGARSG